MLQNESTHNLASAKDELSSVREANAALQERLAAMVTKFEEANKTKIIPEKVLNSRPEF